MSGQITVRLLTQEERDAETGWDEGDLVYVTGVGLTAYTGDEWSSAGGGVWHGPFTLYGLRWQTVDFSGDVPAAGTYKLVYGGVQTAAIAYNANAVAVQAALELNPALTGKVTVDDQASAANTIDVTFDPSLAPHSLLSIAANTMSVADPLVYVGGSLAITTLLTPAVGDIVEDFYRSVPEAFGSGTGLYFQPESGDVDWPTSMELLVDQQDASDNWGTAYGSDDSAYFSTVRDALINNSVGSYNTLPAVKKMTDGGALLANLNLAGQGSGGIVNVWVKISRPVPA